MNMVMMAISFRVLPEMPPNGFAESDIRRLLYECCAPDGAEEFRYKFLSRVSAQSLVSIAQTEHKNNISRGKKRAAARQKKWQTKKKNGTAPFFFCLYKDFA
jgi:hypothetical protein